jgi:uncharacterized membrane protein YeaQ/YmgE (transglycosylase-associated protein family)
VEGRFYQRPPSALLLVRRTKGPLEAAFRCNDSTFAGARFDPTTIPGRLAAGRSPREDAMFNFWTVMYLLFVGIFAGFIARLLLPGRDQMGFWLTVLIGVIGSFVGGFLGYLLFGFDDDEGAIQPGGIFGSIIGAILVLLAWRAYKRHQEGRAAPPTSTA